MATTSQCSGQNQDQLYQISNRPPQTTYPQTNGSPSQNSNGPNRNYSDSESIIREPSSRKESQMTPLPPEPLTEFQKFVASTTGQILPVFGEELFRRVPSTFAPLDVTPVPPDYVIGQDDELRIRVWGQLSFQSNLRVDRSGDVYLPQVGTIHVAGLPYSQLDSHLRGAVARVYRNFDLTVDLGQIGAIQVYVAGQARRPGAYTVSSLSTLVNALFASGGPSIQGSLRHILLRRGNEVVTDFDLYGLLVHGDKSKDVKLLSGDVIYIPPVGPQVAVTGSVRKSAIYEFQANETLSGVLDDAGGTSAVASKARVSIERIDDHSGRHAMEVAFDKVGLATPLADGDLISVLSIVAQYQKTVFIRGNIANPGRFEWHPGMHISDLIPDKDSLLTRNYWWKRAQLGLSAPEFALTAGFASQSQPTGDRPVTINLHQASAAEGQLNQDGGTGGQLGTLQGQSDTGQDSPANYQRDRLSAQQRGGSASLALEQTAPSPGISGNQQITEIHRTAPEIDWDYAVIERLDPNTLRTALIPFDLGKLVMQHDPSQDIELQPGDAVSIFSEGDIRIPIAEQTKLVRLDGEFVHAGVYTVQPGETLRHLVERAGGVTPNAYLYGSAFTRESTRAAQQARLDEYVRNLSLRIQHSNLALAASPVTSAQDLASGAAGQNSQQELLSSLRQIRATGRVVLQFEPNSSGTGALPDITMEDGDHFVVPPIPATVSVVGAVYDQNSFLYAQERRIGSYLRLAGGPNRDADRKQEYIIRANGEVVGHESIRGPWGNEFNGLHVNPGDTIVVPEKTFKPSALRGLIDWSQVFSQLALGSAAVSVLR